MLHLAEVLSIVIELVFEEIQTDDVSSSIEIWDKIDIYFSTPQFLKTPRSTERWSIYWKLQKFAS